MSDPIISYYLDVEVDDTPVRGNAIASGDSKFDKAVENDILKRLDRGEVWAWALVKVTARVEVDDCVFMGTAHLGGCSYKNEAQFRKDGYYKDMCSEAREDLLANMRNDVKRGRAAMALNAFL